MSFWKLKGEVSLSIYEQAIERDISFHETRHPDTLGRAFDDDEGYDPMDFNSYEQYDGGGWY